MNKAVHLTSRGLIRLAGPDSRTLLQGIITNDIKRLGPEKPLYAALLSPQGKYLFDFFLHQQTDDSILMDCEAARLADLMRKLMLYRLRAQVEITDASSDYEVWALIGDDHLPDPRNAALGSRVVLPTGAVPNSPAGNIEDYETLRLSLGIPDGSRDIEIDKRPILEANFERLNGVSFTKGCYVGQEVTARMHYRSAVRKKLYGVTVAGGAPESMTTIFAGDKKAGHILSSLGEAAIALIRDEYIAEKSPLTADGKGVSIVAGRPHNDEEKT